MLKIERRSSVLSVLALAGIDADSEGLAKAEELGIATTAGGMEGLLALPEFRDVRIVFDATSAYAHRTHELRLRDYPSLTLIDLTPAAVGPYVVPVVNLSAERPDRVMNMVSCGGQATIPIVAAISRVARVHYAEIVASLASRSAGPGTRANIDEFTRTTGRALESVGGAAHAKAIIVLNPAEPPMIMRNTVFVLSEATERRAIVESVEKMVAAVQSYVPGYRLKQALVFEDIPAACPVRIPGRGSFHGLKTSVFLEVRGSGDHLAPYAGNLDIMTSAALGTAEGVAQLRYR